MTAWGMLAEMQDYAETHTDLVTYMLTMNLGAWRTITPQVVADVYARFLKEKQ